MAVVSSRRSRSLHLQVITITSRGVQSSHLYSVVASSGLRIRSPLPPSHLHCINKSLHSVSRRIQSPCLVVVSGRCIRSLHLQVITITFSRCIQLTHSHLVVTSSRLCIRSSHPVVVSGRRFNKSLHEQVVTFSRRFSIWSSHMVVAFGCCIRSSHHVFAFISHHINK